MVIFDAESLAQEPEGQAIINKLSAGLVSYAGEIMTNNLDKGLDQWVRYTLGAKSEQTGRTFSSTEVELLVARNGCV